MVELDWKSLSDKKIFELLDNKDIALKKEFASKFLKEKPNGGFTVNNVNSTKEWLDKHFGNEITWKNRPTENKTRETSAGNKMASWLNL